MRGVSTCTTCGSPLHLDWEITQTLPVGSPIPVKYPDVVYYRLVCSNRTCDLEPIPVTIDLEWSSLQSP